MKLSNLKLIKFTFELREAYLRNSNESRPISDLFRPIISRCYPNWTQAYINQCLDAYMAEITSIYKDSKYIAFNLDNQTTSKNLLFPLGNVSIRVDFLSYCLNYFLDIRTSILTQNVSEYLDELTNNINELSRRMSEIEAFMLTTHE